MEELVLKIENLKLDAGGQELFRNFNLEIHKQDIIGFFAPTGTGKTSLFNYIAQSRTGAIAESLETGKRTNFAANAGITTLEDISIYTMEGEVKLKDVLVKMHEALGDKDIFNLVLRGFIYR